MQATDAPTPISQRNETLLAAKRAQEQREQGIRANGIKQGRELERKEIQERAGVSMIDELSMLAQIRMEHEAADRANELRWMREEAKHGRAKYWQGAAIWGMLGAAAGAASTSLMIFAMQGVIWDASARNAGQLVTVGAAIDGARQAAGQPPAPVQEQAPLNAEQN